MKRHATYIRRHKRIKNSYILSKCQQTHVLGTHENISQTRDSFANPSAAPSASTEKGGGGQWCGRAIKRCLDEAPAREPPAHESGTRTDLR